MGVFPHLADDEVHQWLLEYALMERLEVMEAAEARQRMLAERATQAEQRVLDRLTRQAMH